MDVSLSTLRDHQRQLRETVAARFAIEHEEMRDCIFFRSGSHRVSLGRACELPLEGMSRDALQGAWCQHASVLQQLTAAAVHLLRQMAHANVLSLDSKNTELFLGHVPLTVEVNHATATPGCVIIEHSPIVLGIGWLDSQGQIEWYTSDSGAHGFREEPRRINSIQFH